MENTHSQRLQDALYELLLPLARLNLHYGLTAKEFNNISKQAYVDAVRADYGIRGRPTNKSRIAALTGLTRAEIQRLVDSSAAINHSHKPSPLQRLVSLWIRDENYQNSEGNSAIISIDEGQYSFTALARQCGGDIPWQTLLKELIRLGIVEQNDGQLSLLQQGFFPQIDDNERLPFLGSEVSTLIDTISHNLRSTDDNLRFQRKTAFTQLSPEGVEVLEKFAHEKGQALLQELDQLLSQYTVENSTNQTSTSDTTSHYAGLGMYVFNAENKKP